MKTEKHQKKVMNETSKFFKELARMFKNKLQEYAQKRGLPFPAYRTANEGLVHLPEFRSTVLVNGSEYTSKLTFRRLREAEQDAAKLAYECLISNDRQMNVQPLIQKDSKSNKTILYEYAWKQQWNIPTYKTCISEQGSVSVFVSKVTVGGKTFTGDAGKNTKDSEQLAARAALEALLGSDTGALLKQKVSLKRKRYEDLKRVKFGGSSEKKPSNTSVKGPAAVSKMKVESR